MMSTTVKSLKVTHNPVNEDDTFTHGDVVTGQVTLEVVKECHIDSLSIKFKGKAEVLWQERYGQTTIVYHSKDKYFSTKIHFVQDGEGAMITDKPGETYNTVVAPGIHIYPFSFDVPEGDFPSSMSGIYGKIIYTLEARLGRSMRIPKKETEKLNFVGSVDLAGERGLLEPQHDCKDKKLRIFSSGTVSMDVRLDKTGYFQGEGMTVTALIQNHSTRPIKPKYCLYRKYSFFAAGKRKVEVRNLFREVGDPIPPSSEEKVTRVITVPLDVEPSIHNCVNITSEHRLKVYLDVKFATDPVIKFPVVILPISGRTASASSSADSKKKALWNPESSDEDEEPSEPPAWSAEPSGEETDTEASDPPPPYGAYDIYPPPSQ